MSAHVLLNISNEVGGKEIKCEACPAFYRLFATNLICSGARMLDSICHKINMTF